MRQLKKSPQEIREARRERREQLTRGQDNIAPGDDDEAPIDMDQFRNELARRISRAVGNVRKSWRGCREPSCRRQRACVAPRIHCSNAPPLPPDPTGERAKRALAHFHRMLREHVEREEGE